MKILKFRKLAIAMALGITVLSGSLGTAVGMNTNTITAEAKVSANVSVSTVQRCLNRFYTAFRTAHGYYPWSTSIGYLSVDGICGANTNTAIKGFQRYEGLAVDGDCGTATWNKLRHYNY